MSARPRKPPTRPPERPSDDAPTTIYDSGELPARRRPSPTAKGSAPPDKATIVDKPRPPVVAVSKKEQSQPIRAISMKTPDNPKPIEPANPPTPIIPRPKLRAISEVTPVQQNLGNLAPPYDPKEARSRSMQEYVIWGCLAVILASAIALVVWFVAR